MKEDFLISVIMPLYNVEEFFEEAIESIINQTIGFEDNIQIILVNDGSPDNIESLCLKYKNKYPSNILYVKQSNGGVSSARNLGMQYIKGRYVNFFDADDKWDKDAYRLAYEFLQEHSEEIDVAACRYYFFGKREGFIHPLDDKHSKERIINISGEPQSVHMAVNSIIIRANAIMDLQFDTRLKLAEDTIFATKLICKKGKYGVIPSAIYNYRKRMNNNSAIDMTTSNRSWFFDTPVYCLKELFRYSQEKFGKIIPYIQYIVMYDLQWRMRPQIPTEFTIEQRNLYINHIKDLLQNIEDTIIVKQKKINFIDKINALRLKYGTSIIDQLTINQKGNVLFNDVKVFNVRQQHKLQIDFLDIYETELVLQGSTQLRILDDNYQILCLISDGSVLKPEFFSLPYKNITGFTGETIFTGTGFKIKVPLKPGVSIKFVLRKAGEKDVKLKPTLNRYARLSNELPQLYYRAGQYLIKFKNQRFQIKADNIKNRFIAGCRLVKELIKRKKFSLLGLRIQYHLRKPLSKKPVWICSDRMDIAKDNGERFFRYLRETKAGTDYNLYFAIDEKSPDYQRMKQYGKVLPLDSKKYKRKFLLADNIISSHADLWVYDAFGDDTIYVKDLLNFNFVFLQHGIIKDDFSSWLHKHNKNIKIFITSSEQERDSILEGNYGYSPENVVLTGLPRFDALENHPKKQILILPTWRKKLAASLITGETDYLKTFKESDYFRFYNTLINDPLLKKKLKEYDYTAAFYIHPMFRNQAVDFEGNETIKVVPYVEDYSKLFAENALLVTDYSSIYFDFAYLKKPVIYSMFDYDDYYNTHTCKRGYFDYERDGFGPCCYDYQTTVQEIISLLEKDCIMEDKYINRVEDFFAWTDKNNCQRVYNAIKDMK